MSEYHLAHLNVALLKAPYESPVMAEFIDNLEPINALADASQGFVWRLPDEIDDSAIHPFAENILVNLSVWQDVASLKDFVFRTAHAGFLKRRQEWFDPQPEKTMVLWWVPAGHIPTEVEAEEKLQLIRREGPTLEAFNFREVFPSP